MWQVTLAARPEAGLRWNTTGINPKEGAVYDGSPIEIDGRQKTTLYVYAAKGGVSAQRTFTLDAVGAQKTIDENRPTKAKRDFQFASKGEVLRVVRAAKGKMVSEQRAERGTGFPHLDNFLGAIRTGEPVAARSCMLTEPPSPSARRSTAIVYARGRAAVGAHSE